MRCGVPYFVCTQCHHYLSVYRALTEAGLWGKQRAPEENDAKPFLGRLLCSECGSKQVDIVKKLEKRPSGKVIATDRGANRVFHKPRCHFASKIDLKDVIEFDNVEDAERQAYVACGFCFGTPSRWLRQKNKLNR